MYKRNCPLCNIELTYTHKHVRDAANRKNGNCRACSSKITAEKNRKQKFCLVCSIEIYKGRCCSKECSTILRKQTMLEKYGNENYNNRNKAKNTLTEKYGVDNVAQIPEVKQKVSEKGRYFSRIDVSGKNNPHYGYTHTDEAKRKQRVRRIESLNKRQAVFPGYNPNACKAIDEYGKQHGYTFKHAENGGEWFIEELGYYVDGYDPIQNVVIEYDELHHFDKDGNLRNRDIVRQNEIIEHLNCKFIRISEKN